MADYVPLIRPTGLRTFHGTIPFKQGKPSPFSAYEFG
jgi:hypothetical protein